MNDVPIENVIAYNGDHFKQTTWHGIRVLQHMETGYYNASKACKESGNDFKLWYRNPNTNDLLTHASEQLHLPTGGGGIDSLLYRVSEEDVQGYYIHPSLFYNVCYWSNQIYAFEVNRLLHLIDAENVITNQKAEKESHVIYAKPIGDSHFQLKFASNQISSKVDTLHHIEIDAGKDVLKQVLEQFDRRGLLVKENGKRLLPLEYLDEAFEQIIHIKDGNDTLLQNQKIEYINSEMERLADARQTPQVEGKQFELSFIKSNEKLIPWALVPLTILEKINETRKETGIDAVVIEDEQITEIIRIKHHRNGHLRIDEVESFLNKASTTAHDIEPIACTMNRIPTQSPAS